MNLFAVISRKSSPALCLYDYLQYCKKQEKARLEPLLRGKAYEAWPGGGKIAQEQRGIAEIAAEWIYAGSGCFFRCLWSTIIVLLGKTLYER